MIQAGRGIWGRGWSEVLADDPSVELAGVAYPDPAAEGTPAAAADNAKSLAVTLGCFRSVETGETVDVPALLAAAGRVANADRVG